VGSCAFRGSQTEKLLSFAYTDILVLFSSTLVFFLIYLENMLSVDSWLSSMLYSTGYSKNFYLADTYPSLL